MTLLIGEPSLVANDARCGRYSTLSVGEYPDPLPGSSGENQTLHRIPPGVEEGHTP